MELSSPRFKALAVTLGFSIWFLIITLALELFSFEAFGIFIVIMVMLTQIFSVKLSKVLDVFAIFNTKVFLGIIFVVVISLYGILFRILGIDALRLKKQKNNYWAEIEESDEKRIFKQY